MAFLRASSTGSTPRSSTSSDGGLVQVDMAEHYEVLKQLGTGTYGRCVLARCRATDQEVALKLLKKNNTKFRDFLREFNCSYFLSAHPCIADTYDVAFETPEDYVFAQEYAPLGDLFEFIPPQRGLQEDEVKLVSQQIASGLEFLHSKSLVHRDVKPENVLVLECDLSRVKLIDFGMSRTVGTLVRKTSVGIPYTPPEVAQAVRNEAYQVDEATDVWALGVLIFCCLTGNFPWELATPTDRHYEDFYQWQRRKVMRIPSQFRHFSPRLLRLFRRLLESKPEKRCGVREISKYLEDDWMVLVGRCPKPSTSGGSGGGSAELEESHMSTEEQEVAHLERLLVKCGVETKVSKKTKELRVAEWLRAGSALASDTESI